LHFWGNPMNTEGYKRKRSAILSADKVVLSVIICFMLSSQNANASPPAVTRNDISMYIRSEAVLEAVVKSSKRWSDGGRVLHMVAEYKVIDVFKGNVQKDEILIVTDTCLDEPIPEHMLGYPVVEEYCRGGIGLTNPDGPVEDEPIDATGTFGE